MKSAGAALEAALATAKDAWNKERASLEQRETEYIMKSEKLQHEVDMLTRKQTQLLVEHKETLTAVERKHTQSFLPMPERPQTKHSTSMAERNNFCIEWITYESKAIYRP